MHVLVSLVVSLIMSTVHCFNKILETYPIFIIANVKTATSTFTDLKDSPRNDSSSIHIKPQSMKYFLHLLDTYNVGQEAGVDEYTFQDIFYVCYHCGRYMTKRMASAHHDIEFDESESDPQESTRESSVTRSPYHARTLASFQREPLCIYLRKEIEEESNMLDVINPRAYREKHLIR